MRHRPPSIARPALVLALTAALLGGCAEMHRGVEAVGRVGSSAAPAGSSTPDEDAEAAPISRPDVKTVRRHGAARAPNSDTGEAEPAEPPAVVASAVPSPRQIFDFHPAGSRPDSWREPFVIDTRDGPLAADVRRSAAELKAFLAARKTGDARLAGTGAGKTGAGRMDAAGVDGVGTGTTRKSCGEMDVAAAKPGCGVPRPQASSGTPGAPAVP